MRISSAKIMASAMALFLVPSPPLVSAQPSPIPRGQLKKLVKLADGTTELELFENGPSFKFKLRPGRGPNNPMVGQDGTTTFTIIETDCDLGDVRNPGKGPEKNKKKCIAGSLTHGLTGKVYYISRRGEVFERDQADYPPEEDPPNEDDPSQGPDADNIFEKRSLRAGAMTPGGRSLQPVTPVIDVLVVYTQGAKADAQNYQDGPIEDLINLAIVETNQAYVNSGIDAELNLIAMHEDTTGYTDDQGSTSMLPSLNHLTYQAGNSNDPDGKLDYIHDLRSEVGADMVALITTGAGCGIAWLSGNCVNCYPNINSQFSVTKYSCATGYYSFGHELGHNMGCNHDKGTKDTCGSADYRYGYRDPNAQYRSILAYDCYNNAGECDLNAGTRCTRSQFFSTPDPNYTWNGNPMGKSSGDATVGETNNAKRINERAAYIAAFYTVPQPTLAPTPAPTSAPVSPTPAPTSAPVSPTTAPSQLPTSAPVTSAPVPPTPAPTASPTSPPSLRPSPQPTLAPVTPAPVPPTPVPTPAPTCGGNKAQCTTNSDCCSFNCKSGSCRGN